MQFVSLQKKYIIPVLLKTVLIRLVVSLKSKTKSFRKLNSTRLNSRNWYLNVSVRASFGQPKVQYLTV